MVSTWLTKKALFNHQDQGWNVFRTRVPNLSDQSIPDDTNYQIRQTLALNKQNSGFNNDVILSPKMIPQDSWTEFQDNSLNLKKTRVERAESIAVFSDYDVPEI
jgi:hypothetical protein